MLIRYIEAERGLLGEEKHENVNRNVNYKPPSGASTCIAIGFHVARMAYE